MKPKRVARYCRVSTAEQSPELQLDETSGFISRREGWELVASYVDRGVSGSKDRRPELDRLLADARKRRFDVLVVWKSDRLFRSLPNMVRVIGELDELGIEYVSCTEPFDTTTPQGVLLLHILSAMGQFERSLTIERVRAGMAVARRKGKRIGRPSSGVDTAAVGRLRAQGRSIREIARELGTSSATVGRILEAVSKRCAEPTSQVVETMAAE